jgi:phage gp29-like protein
MALRRKEYSYWVQPTPSLSSWSVSGVRQALTQHEQGDFRFSAHLAEAMERNPRIMGALTTRVRGVLGLPFSVEAAKFNPQRADGVAKDLEAKWPRIMPETAKSKLLRWYVTLGVAIGERVWDTRGGEWTPRVKPIPSMSLVRWREDLNRYVIETREDGEVVIEPGGDWYILEQDESRSWMRGVVRCLGLEDKIRTEAVRDWSRWSEKHGLPIGVAKVPSEASDPDKNAYFDSLSNLGRESTILAPQGEGEGKSFGYELLSPGNVEGWKGFAGLLDFVAADAAIAINGQNLTQEVKGGSLAAATAHDRVRSDYLEADSHCTSAAEHDQVIIDWTIYNYGDARLAPTTKSDATPPEDKAQIANTVKTAGEAFKAWEAALAPHGLSVDAKVYAERFGIPTKAGAVQLPTPAPVPGSKDPPAQDEQQQ